MFFYEEYLEHSLCDSPAMVQILGPGTYFGPRSWWCHQMETFSVLLALCDGSSPFTGEIPTQRPVTRSSDVFFDLRLNKRLSKQLGWFETPSRPLWRHRNVPQILVSACHAKFWSLVRHIWLPPTHNLFSGTRNVGPYCDTFRPLGHGTRLPWHLTVLCHSFVSAEENSSNDSMKKPLWQCRNMLGVKALES